MRYAIVMDPMKTRALIPILLLAFRGVLLSAELPADAVPPPGARLATPEERAVFDDFRRRLEAAIESRELASIAALYQTNDVTAAELKFELARWGHGCEVGSKPVSLFFKAFDRLPPESHRFWTEKTRRLTRFQVTHVVMVRANELALTLPLNLVGGKLLIVPSEKLADKSLEPAAKESR